MPKIGVNATIFLEHQKADTGSVSLRTAPKGYTMRCGVAELGGPATVSKITAGLILQAVSKLLMKANEHEECVSYDFNASGRAKIARRWLRRKSAWLSFPFRWA
jgi:hypothetical protein